MQGNLITAPAELYDTFDFVIYTCAAKSTIKKLNVAKISQTWFKICCYHVTNVVADGKIFHSQLALPENLLLFFQKTAYQYLCTFSSIFVFYKLG